jgi:hypothetical protein
MQLLQIVNIKNKNIINETLESDKISYVANEMS